MNIDIQNFSDYREYLRYFYETKKESNSNFSYRFIGQKVSMDPGLIVKVFQGKRHLSKEKVKEFISLCKLNSDQAEYFKALVKYGKAKSLDEIKIYYEKLLSLKKTKYRMIEQYEYEYYHEWYYSAIRSLIGITEFCGDYKEISKRLSPPITVNQAKKAITLLEKLDFIKQDLKSGIYTLTENMITTGEKWQSVSIRKFQSDTLHLADFSLQQHPKEMRDISTLSLSLSWEEFDHIKEKTREFRQSILNYLNEREDLESDEVFQMNFQLFPLTQNSKKRS